MRQVLFSHHFPRGLIGRARLDCLGPPNPEVLAAELSARARCDIGGIVVDLRGHPLDDDIARAVTELRAPLCEWLSGLVAERPHNCPLVLLCEDEACLRGLVGFAKRVCDCPSFWFATGCELLLTAAGADPKEKEEDDDGGDGVLAGAVAALRRLAAHPLVAEGVRGDELFYEHRVDALGVGRRAFVRPRRGMGGKRRELRVVVPSTFQIEGGTSVELPRPDLDRVLRHVVIELTADRPGVPSKEAGCTLLEGQGWWYSADAGRFVDERVRVAHIQLEIEEEQVASLVRYLRFAWLQTTIFCTLDGAVVEP